MITQSEKNTKESLTGLRIKMKVCESKNKKRDLLKTWIGQANVMSNEGGKDLIPKINSLIIISLLEMHPGVS